MRVAGIQQGFILIGLIELMTPNKLILNPEPRTLRCTRIHPDRIPGKKAYEKKTEDSYKSLQTTLNPMRSTATASTEDFVGFQQLFEVYKGAV